MTSSAFVLTIENPDRFQKSRDVGPYLGLAPKQDESGESSPQLRITETRVLNFGAKAFFNRRLAVD